MDDKLNKRISILEKKRPGKLLKALQTPTP
jgi:hypothetical protein